MKTPIDQQTPEEMGRDAFDAGLDSDCNPWFRGSRNRQRWFNGYYGRIVEISVERNRKVLGLEDD